MRTQHEWQLRNRLDQLADDVGRLQRRVDPESSLHHVVALVACHVEALYGFVDPTAAELAAWTAPGDDQAVLEALRLVDVRTESLRHRLGIKAAA